MRIQENNWRDCRDHDMTATLASRTWIYRQTHAGAELKLSTTAHEGGVYHLLFIGGRSEDAVGALSDAVASIQKNPASVSEFVFASFIINANHGIV